MPACLTLNSSPLTRPGEPLPMGMPLAFTKNRERLRSYGDSVNIAARRQHRSNDAFGQWVKDNGLD